MYWYGKDKPFDKSTIVKRVCPKVHGITTSICLSLSKDLWTEYHQLEYQQPTLLFSCYIDLQEMQWVLFWSCCTVEESFYIKSVMICVASNDQLCCSCPCNYFQTSLSDDCHCCNCRSGFVSGFCIWRQSLKIGIYLRQEAISKENLYASRSGSHFREKILPWELQDAGWNFSWKNTNVIIVDRI